jgi:RNA polymerase sigma-70 factor (ECF subfamily)
MAHLDMLYNLARRMSSSREEAEDLVQDTCVRALSAWRRRTRPDHMGPWLATICLNAARSGRKRAATRLEIPDPDPGQSTPSSQDTEEQALAGVDRTAIREAIARLPVEQREAITLMDMCGFTASRAAEILGAPRNTVLSRVHRGRKRLAALLDEQVGNHDA